VNMITRK